MSVVVNPMYDDYGEGVSRRVKWRDLTYWPDNPISVARLNTMRKRWGGYREPLVGVPTVVDNGGGAFPELPGDALVTADGNHRQKLAEEAKRLDDLIVVHLRQNLTRAQCAHLRRGLNDRRTVKPAEAFLELVQEGDIEKAAIMGTVQNLGWRISHERTPGGLSCTKELEWIWKQDHGAMVRAIETYEGAWGQRPYSGQAGVIKGLGAFWIRFPEAMTERMIRVLTNVTVDDIYRTGRNHYRETSFIKNIVEGVVYTLGMHYNRGLRSGKVPLS